MKHFVPAASVAAVCILSASVSQAVTDNSFNPAISVILDGGYANYEGDPEDYELAGFALGGEAEPPGAGFTIGHTEVNVSANIDSNFFGKLTFALVEEEGARVTELEEAYIETISLGNGFRVRGGKFFSSISYLNQQHEHAWDFRDAPLIYRGLFGKHYIDDGLQVNWIAPTDMFIELGVELLAGAGYPAGGEQNNIGASTIYLSLGGDISDSSSWLAGVSRWEATDITREYGGHAHGGGEEEDIEFEGDSDITALYAVYKWAPSGNFREERFKLQFEMFSREDQGSVTIEEMTGPETSTLDSEQEGWYLQAIYGWSPFWNAGIRYDSLESDNTGNDTMVLDEVGLLDGGHDPSRTSVMVEWVPSEFSRVRVQLSRDESTAVADDQLHVQYTYSLGAHGAHTY